MTGDKKVGSGLDASDNRRPTNWVTPTLGEVYTVVGGGTPSTEKADYWGTGTPWVTSADIHGVRDIKPRKQVTTKGIENSTTQIVPRKTLLVVTRVGLGKIAITETETCFSQDVQGLIQYPDLIAPEFALYFLSYELQILKHQGRGTTISGITKKQLTDLEFPLPPYKEQLRIVAKIEELLSELDKGVENLRTAQQQLKVYRQALLKHAFKGELTAEATQIPTDAPWPKRKLGDLLDFLTSGSRGWAAYYADTGDIFIRAQNIKHDRLDLSDIAFVDLPGKTEGLRTKVQKGDLLITITGANVTKTALVEHSIGTAYVSQHVALCRPSDEVLPKFLYWYIVAEAAGRKQLTDLAYGAGKPGLNLENIRSVNVHLPDLVEQARVVELIENKLSVVEDFEKTITHSLQQAEALRQSILKKAFSGQLVAQDANDEPASVLLERIKAEKQARLVTGKRAPRTSAAAQPDNVVAMPVRIPGIASTDLHAGILALAYSAHEAESKYLPYFGHVKSEKVSHLVEAHLGIELDRAPVKDAAGPNDYPHLKKVESRARKVGWFDMQREPGATAYSLHKLAGFNELQMKTRKALGPRLNEVEALLRLLLPLNTRQAEIVATLYAAWNNLLLAGQQPSDQQIIFEARDNWHPDKLKIELWRFEKGLVWMREHELTPRGQGRRVEARRA